MHACRKDTKQALCYLIDAILEMVTNSDNIIANRIELVKSIKNLLHCLPREIVQNIVAALLPLAKGEISESQIGMSHSDAINPLNPIKMGSGDPVTLRGISLATLSDIEENFPGTVPDLHDNLLLQALSDSDSKLKGWGCAAACQISRLTNQEYLAVLLCTADNNPKVASHAFGVFHDRHFIDIETSTWLLLTNCLEQGSASLHTDVRQSVAKTVFHLLNTAGLPDDIHDRFQKVKETLSTDLSYAVRTNIHGGD